MKIDIQKIVLWASGVMLTGLTSSIFYCFGWMYNHSHEVTLGRKFIENLEHNTHMMDSIRYFKQRDLYQTKEIVRLSARLDSVEWAVQTIKVGKQPINEIIVWSRRDSVYKSFPINTEWIWRKRD